MTGSRKQILLFDGVCNLCNGSVTFIVKRDPHKKFLFSPIQSEQGQELLRQFNLPEGDINSFVLIEGDRIYLRSTAGLRVLRQLHGLWPLLFAISLVPRPIRDFIYNIIAGSRYKLFGKQESCMIPSIELKCRFLK